MLLLGNASSAEQRTRLCAVRYFPSSLSLTLRFRFSHLRSPSMKWFAPAVGLVVGLLVGFFIFGRGAEGSDPLGSSYGSSYPGSAPDLKASSAKANVDEPKFELTAREAEVSEATGLTRVWLKSLESETQFDQFGLLHEKIGSARVEDFPALMDAVRKSGESMQWMARSMLATRWADSDPQGMMAYIANQPENERWGLANTFFGAWAKSNPDAAYAAALQIEGRNQQNSAINAVIQSIAVDDPRRAVNIALELQETSGRRSSWAIRNVFSNWSRDEPEAARQMALDLPDGPMKVQALTGALDQMMNDDPLGALAWLDSLPPDGTTYNARKQVFRNLLNKDFDTAKEFIELQNDPLERREILNNVYFGNFAWNKDFEEIEGMFDWMGTVTTGQVYDNKVSDIVRTMVDSDKQRAIDFALQLGPGNARMNALGSVASQLVQSDPEGALSFALSLAYKDEKMRALGNMSWNLARNHPETARRLIAESEDPLVQQQLASAVAREWSLYERDGALTWAEGLTDDQARQSSLNAVLRNWVQSDPGAAFGYIDTEIPEGRRSDFYSNAYNNWARQDPGLAAKWLTNLPEDVDRPERLYRTVANAYVSHDPMAASEWISSLDAGVERDSAVNSLVNNISRSDPEAAFIWSSTVDDEKKRADSLRRSVREWVKEDADAAYEAIADAEISAEEKKPLLEIVEKQRK